jgi:hypothetical protein
MEDAAAAAAALCAAARASVSSLRVLSSSVFKLASWSCV